jgi:glucose/mannose transport system substrate-binding protein
MATPGSQDSFVYNPDCFPLMVGGNNPDGAIGLLSTFASVGGQDVFNPIKGSIPARIDADASHYDVASQRTMTDFQSKQLVLSTSGLIPTASSDAIDRSMATFVDSHNPDDVISVIRDNYPNFKP